MSDDSKVAYVSPKAAVSPVSALQIRDEPDLPYVRFLEGFHFKLIHADVEAGLWVVRTRIAPGVTLPTHKHTGEVFALTLSGAWKYLEHEEMNVAGTYLYEPAGSVHTLHTPATNTSITDAWFAIRGANLNLNDDGTVESVWDASFNIETYMRLCREEGHPEPQFIRKGWPNTPSV